MSDFKLNWNDESLTAEVLGICKRVTKDKAEDIAADARANCPKDSGELAEKIEVVEFQKKDAVGAYIKAGGKDLGHIARFVELGTPGTEYKSGERKDSERTPVKAKPYLRPALKKHKRGYASGFKDKLK